MSSNIVWFHDVLGNAFKVQVLDKHLAIEYCDWIVETHNQIPFQFWEKANVLAEQDENRMYYGKWEVSRIAFSEAGEPIAFCIGFELAPDFSYYHKPGFYLHRLAVSINSQGKLIGALLQTETIAQIFIRGFRYIGSPRDPVLIWGQTNMVPTNESVIHFHKAAGFREAGEKPYSDRVDLIMRMDVSDFWNSHHVVRWRMHREAR